ncbi:MAG: hypothetical protein V4599_14085 [Verrucomicrobiota bacterium]
MSESENTPTPPPPSTPKTAAVPLKKETVRITLRSRPGAGATQPREATAPVSPISLGVAAPDITPKRSTAPIQLPSAPLPPPAPKSATAPVKLPPAPMDVSRKTTSAVPVVASPAPSAPAASMPMPPAPRPLGAPPAATVPMAAPRPPSAPGAPPSAPGAPRPPMAPGAPGAAPVAPGAPRMETGATTAPLKTMPTRPAVSAPRTPGAAGTAPLAAGPGAGTGSLPKATVKLQQTQPMARPSISAPPSAPVKRTAASDSQQFYEEKDPEEGLMPLSVVCLLFSVVLLVIQMFGSDRISASTDSPIMVPPAVPVKWERPLPDGSWTNEFISGGHLPALPQ